MRGVLVFVVLWLAAAPAAAESDPIRCWWVTGEGAVAIGEPFDATLTCAVREQDGVRAVPDESRLGAAVIQLAPFEVLGGSHPADVRSPTHRFFQYLYRLRIIDRDVIGQDARFPDLQVAYRVDAHVNGEWVEGRDRSYVVPGGAVRVLSMVPADAADIRDSGGASLARVETLRFRARALEIAAFALVALGLIVGAPAVRALVHRARPASRVQDEVVPRQIALRAADAELARVERDARAGWTPELVGRALIALRIAAAAVLARPVAHHSDGGGLTGGDGRLVASVGRLRRHQVEMSSALTPVEMQAAIAALPATVTATRREALDDLQRAMQLFTAALYGTAALDAARLDEAVASARRAAERAVPPR
jgi:hypothetical protein